MTIEKMKAGRRTPRNPIVLEVMRDYGYVDARGMGVRTKVIPLTRQFTGIDPYFEAGDDYFKTTIMARSALDSSEQFVPEKRKESNKYQDQGQNVPENVLKDVPQKTLVQQVLSLIKENPRISYNQMAQRTGRHRKTIQRHIQFLKDRGLLRRKGGARGGYWEVDVP
ncbi:MAG: winged helix-turn-helix transcriptional regulator [Desulfohalobiaceae bacterium]|nr:winged helix-turn-helix transcriptional regulator [Desulfohalobiaceae bacterium]